MGRPHLNQVIQHALNIALNIHYTIFLRINQPLGKVWISKWILSFFGMINGIWMSISNHLWNLRNITFKIVSLCLFQNNKNSHIYCNSGNVSLLIYYYLVYYNYRLFDIFNLMELAFTFFRWDLPWFGTLLP